MTKRGWRSEIGEPQFCPFCKRGRTGENLQRHLMHVHRAAMVLVEYESGEQFWPDDGGAVREAEVVRKSRRYD